MALSKSGLVGDVAALVVGLGIGVAIGVVDSSPHWDDTGITVAALVLGAGALALVRPRVWWVIALAVGLPVPAFNLVRHGNLQSAAAVGFAVAAAGAARLLTKALHAVAPGPAS